MPSQLFAVVPDKRYIVLQLQVSTMDMDACNELQNLMEEQLDIGVRPVILDLTRAKFLPSLALGAMVEQKRRLDAVGSHLTIVGLAPNIRKAMSISHLDHVFVLVDNLQTAVTAQAAP